MHKHDANNDEHWQQYHTDQHLDGVVVVRFVFWLGLVRYTSCVKFNDDGGDNEDGDDSLKVIKKTRPWKVIISFFRSLPLCWSTQFSNCHSHRNRRKWFRLW